MPNRDCEAGYGPDLTLHLHCLISNVVSVFVSLVVCLLKCGAIRCQRKQIMENEVTVFTNQHACRRAITLYQHIKSRHLRIYPMRTLETVTKGPITPATNRGVLGVRLELLGCSDTGNLIIVQAMITFIMFAQED